MLPRPPVVSRQKDYELIFMDQMMPGMNGIEAMNQIRRLSSHYAPGGIAKIIVLTANAISGTREKLMEEGFDEYLSKPISFPILENILTTFVPQDRYVYEKTDVSQKEAGKNVVSGERMNTLMTDIRGTLSVYARELDYDLGMERCGGDENNFLEILQLQTELGKNRPHGCRFSLRKINTRNLLS